jgi:TolA-binding protein
VRRQIVGERFLVALPDGELEVRGTTFDVRVEGDATTWVHVDEGVVEVRLHGRGTRRLGANETWALGVAPASAPSARASTSTAAPAPPAVETESATAYATAMRLLGEGRNDEAASAFHAFAASQPGAPQAEDASFLEAVALARMGRGDAAALAAEHHLARFPASFHKREAAILVARAAVHRGECDKARAVLGPWLAPARDPDAQSTLRPCDAR